MCLKQCLLLTIISVLYICQHCTSNYIVPRPTIRAYEPRGFSVSIPDDEGIQLFAFHGKINEGMDHLEAGRFSKDIIKRDENVWVFKDEFTRLKIGDSIYYWLYVQKAGLGYRYDNGFHIISSLESGSVGEDNNNKAKKTISGSQDTHFNAEQLSDVPSQGQACGRLSTTCEGILLNVTSAITDLKNNLDRLNNTNSILIDILKNDSQSSTSLILEGPVNPNDNLQLIVEAILNEKLRLPIRAINITRTKDNFIRFQTKDVREKVQVIEAAKDKLKNSIWSITY